MRSDELFAYARERYNIYLKRQRGEQKPWTQDEYLRQFKFCNVFREDDRTTVWIRENIREPLRDDPSVYQAMLIARWFNRIETLEILKDLILEDKWDSAQARERLIGVQPIITAAYMIRTPNGTDKLTGLLWNIDQVLPEVRKQAVKMDDTQWTLEASTKWLANYPNLGTFLAYEVITDLRHTYLLEEAPDIMTWANPGPGCERGLERVTGQSGNESYMVGIMREILELSKDPANWPAEWPAWEMRDVEHNLCDFDKYERVRCGEGTPKQRYDGGGQKTIMYGQGGRSRNPRAPADPVAMLIRSKLAPHYERIGNLRLELRQELMGAVILEANDVLRKNPAIPENWLPYTETVMVEVGEAEMEVVISPPKRMPAYFGEGALRLNGSGKDVEKKMSELAALEKTVDEKERTLREVLASL